MDIFFNELSCHPLALDNEIAKSKIILILEIMKELKKDGFNAMRTSQTFYSLEIADGYTFSNFLDDPYVKRDLQILLKGIIKKPYIPEESINEAEIFVLTNFKTKDADNNDVSPEGLATAYIYNSPVISLSSHSFWQKDIIPLMIIANDNNVNSVVENIPNIFSVQQCSTNKSFRNWLLTLTECVQLNSKENIELVFSPDKYEFEVRAINEIIAWYYDDKRFIIRLKEIINDIEANPFVGGKGHTEPLVGTNGKASKHIIKKDVVVYTYTKEKIIIHQCRGHYDDK